MKPTHQCMDSGRPDGGVNDGGEHQHQHLHRYSEWRTYILQVSSQDWLHLNVMNDVELSISGCCAKASINTYDI